MNTSRNITALLAALRGWRGQAGTTTQQRWLELEANARQLRVFEPHFVPGLLQTAAYARLRLLAHARVHHAIDNVDDAVAMRLRRQAILQRAEVEFHFLLTEFGLRSGAYGNSSVMTEQIEKISAQVGDNRVRVGILPLTAEWDANVDHGFWMFERSHVLVETVTAELRLNRPEEIDTYWRVFHLLENKAVYGDDARALLGNVLNSLSR
ncbi:DUF5753 domain-containing protein [Nonomuraea sp. NPDC049784]|uniref:DUF5753 domain-containing protein n=1 Tax=Nonomuraea sp. NPDC049784 TaxID=3154361 RepID=UPI0033C2FBF9